MEGTNRPRPQGAEKRARLHGGALTEETVASSAAVLRRGARHKGLQQYFSPPQAAQLAAQVMEGHKPYGPPALDPTAGDGALLGAWPAQLRFGVEIDRDQIKAGDYTAVHGDLQRVYPLLRLAGVRAGAVVCNPPSVLAYAGLRPGEVRALRWDDVRDKTLLVQRSAGADGAAKSTKTRAHRPVRLLAPLAADLRAWRLASGRPDGPTPVFPRHDGTAWTKEDWGNWRERQWAEACSTAGLVTVPRPYDLRHSFASLLLAEGRTIHYVAAQLGHSPALTLSTYGHVLAEFAETDRIDAEAEIAKARGEACSLRVPTASI